MRVVISEFMDAAAVDQLRQRFDTEYGPDLVNRLPELLAKMSHADALIVRNRTQVNREVLDAAPRLKVVGRLGVGLDNIDLAACRARDVQVIPATGANAAAVAEYVIGTAMVLLRGSYYHTAAVAAGEWPRGPLSSGRELGGKVLGLLGFGGIGRLTARMATALGMQVLAHDPALTADAPELRESGAKMVPLPELLAGCDVLSLHVPLTDGTRGLLDRERLRSMKKGAILINTARGGVVDEAALAELLESGHLGGAAIDVFEQEPLGTGSCWSRVAAARNVILTPHIAGITFEANQRVSSLIARRVGDFLATAKG